jgi:antibiotic biosynthesis monooxygenase (ABM) superfamily enzyme
MSFPVTALMTWLVMPQASVLLRRWLFPVRSTAQ